MPKSKQRAAIARAVKALQKALDLKAHEITGVDIERDVETIFCGVQTGRRTLTITVAMERRP